MYLIGCKGVWTNRKSEKEDYRPLISDNRCVLYSVM